MSIEGLNFIDIKKNTPDLDARFLPIIKRAYKNLKIPNYDFAKAGLNKCPYYSFLKILRDFVAVEDFIVGEDDVCISYILKGTDSVWKLDLSLVAPFALFSRLNSAKLQKNNFINSNRSDLIEFERKVLRLLNKYSIEILLPDTLEHNIPLTLYNTPKEKVSLYHALFVDSNILPWE